MTTRLTVNAAVEDVWHILTDLASYSAWNPFITGAGGTVDVSLAVTGDVAQLRVADTGMGIPLEEQDRLFQRFFRSSLATEHAIQGTGLGLHIVRSIAEAHNGRIEFESLPGEGTTFVFTVPLVDARPVVPETRSARPVRRTSQAQSWRS